MAKLIQIAQETQTLQLTWVLNNICTNHCDYCPPSLHSGTNHNYRWEDAQLFIRQLIARYPKIHCAISGGEPTVSPFFPDLVKMFYDAGHTVGITTNGARSVEYWEKISPLLSYACFSYHIAYEDERFIEKVKAASKHTSVAVRVMMDSRQWDRAIKVLETCKLILTDCRVEPVKILAEKAHRENIGDRYTPEQLEWFKNNPGTNASTWVAPESWRRAPMTSKFFYDDGTVKTDQANYIIATGQNDFRGWSCNIGLESLFVGWEGWVKKGNCHQGPQLFNLGESPTNYILPDTAELCVQSTCSCNTDILISKVPIMDKEDPYVRSKLRTFKISTEEEYQKERVRYSKKET